MSNQISFDNSLADDVLTRIQNHYQNRPFRFHLVAWLLIGAAFGITMLPSFSVAALVGFGISGIVFSMILCVFTYPFSGHYSFTITGALVGVAIIPLFSMTGICDPINSQGASVCLLVGALIGSTSTIWQTPLTLLSFAGKAFAQKRVNC